MEEERPGSVSLDLQKVEMIYYVYKCVLEANNHLYPLSEEVSSTLPHFLSLVPVTPHLDNYTTLFRIADFLAAFLQKVAESSL